MIPVRVANEKNLRVRKMETEFFDTRGNHRHIGLEIAVDEDVAFWRGDQIARKSPAPYVVQIARDAKRWEGLRPVSTRLGGHAVSEGKNENQQVSADQDFLSHGPSIG